MDTIELCSGRATFKREAVSIGVYGMAADGTSHRGTPSKMGLGSVCSASYNLASKSGYSANGYWNAKTYEARDGVILQIQANRSSANALDCIAGFIFIRLRKDAGVKLINVKVPYNSDALYGRSIKVFLGSGDIIPVEELRNYGVSLRETTINSYGQPDNIDKLFSIECISAGSVCRTETVTVETKEGVVQTYTIPKKPPRRLRVRKSRNDT